MTAKSFSEMLRHCCGDCEWFNPYVGYDEPREAESGQCWRYPEHLEINSGNSHQCGEWAEKVDNLSR